MRQPPFTLDAVDADGVNQRMIAAHFGSLFDRRSVGDMTAVLQCKGYPGSHVELFHHRENDPDLIEPCLRLNG